jgi:hypothetical protein
MKHLTAKANDVWLERRLQLALSQTRPVELDFSTINVVEEEDLYCKV